MKYVTITLDLTPENLKILQQLCEERPTIKITENGTLEIPVVAGPDPVKPVAPSEPEPAPSISKTDVKAVCLRLSKEGRQEELKAAFAKFGGKKLSDIAEADYPALMKELGDA